MNNIELLGKTVKILLVEDDAEDYIITRELLSEARNVTFLLEWCSEYEKALDIMRETTFDIILVDYQLGKYNGIDFLKAAQTINFSIPIILLTGAGDDRIDLDAMRAGAADYLVKSMMDATLLERSIRYAIERKKSEEHIRKLNESLERRVEERTKKLSTINKKLKKEIEQRKKVEAQIYQLAYYDSLTKLPNRSYLSARLHEAMEAAKQGNHQIALMFIDLDGFKAVNDTHGHQAGDQILQIVAQRLLNCVRESDIVCRHGGDEFIIVLTNLVDLNDAHKVAQKILEKLAESAKIQDKHIALTPSIGISLFPLDVTTHEYLIEKADTAMYHAKQKGKNQYHFFEKGMSGKTTPI